MPGDIHEAAYEIDAETFARNAKRVAELESSLNAALIAEANVAKENARLQGVVRDLSAQITFLHDVLNDPRFRPAPPFQPGFGWDPAWRPMGAIPRTYGVPAQTPAPAAPPETADPASDDDDVRNAVLFDQVSQLIYQVAQQIIPALPALLDGNRQRKALERIRAENHSVHHLLLERSALRLATVVESFLACDESSEQVPRALPGLLRKAFHEYGDAARAVFALEDENGLGGDEPSPATMPETNDAAQASQSEPIATPFHDTKGSFPHHFP